MSRLMQERRRLVSAFLGCALAAMAPGALAQAKKSPASKEPLVFSINEGATTLITAEELFERYTRLAKSTERTLARPVRLEVYPETARFRAELERRRFDIVLVWAIDRLGRSLIDLLGTIILPLAGALLRVARLGTAPRLSFLHTSLCAGDRDLSERVDRLLQVQPLHSKRISRSRFLPIGSSLGIAVCGGALLAWPATLSSVHRLLELFLR